jgi:thiosulfate/3-mercaptopyruvate sulfurtransferase
MVQTILSSETLSQHLDDPTWVVVDCRFDLFDPPKGERDYEAAHIPGAIFAHLDRDLSGPPLTDRGRHPLPSPAVLTQRFGRMGIGPGTQVVAYDDTSGHYAARLWWMLRMMGHEAAAVLDGGWPAWVAAGLPVEAGRREEPPAPALFTGAPHPALLVVREEVPQAGLLVDSRNPERYRGEVEPIDPVAGHIAGAVNRPYGANWTGDGRWKSQEALLAEFTELLGEERPEDAVFYCGSGVSACANLLGMVHAGLPIGRLYVGGWSEWSRDLPEGKG